MSAIMSPAAQERFAAALTEVHEALDWDLLGGLYCEEGGEHFFPAQQREAITDAGLLLAADVGEAVASAPEGPGRSLYVGAAVGELAPMLCEALVMQREVVALNLANPETTEINRALDTVARSLGFDLPSIRCGDWDPMGVGRCQHVWLVSVLTDPDNFPALHDELYGRSGTALATQRGYLPAELAAGRELLRKVLDCVTPGGLITTTDEEFPIFAEQCAQRGWSLEPAAQARLSAIVGDPVRVCRIADGIEPDAS
ncbi:MAG: hypothetical protein ACI8QZ_001893 [Chlamydiales bacterium]|jgi:hypothetical protein